MISGSGTVGVSLSHGGITVDDNSRTFRLFKITGGTNPYTAVEVQLDEAEGVRVPTGVYDVNANAKQLWEVNGNTEIKTGRVVVGHPNPAGVGFLFDVGGIAPTTRTPLAVCVVKTGGVVTDIKITWQNPDGTLECETVSECSGGGGSDCNTVWYCVDGIATEVAVADAPPAGDEVVGPFPDQETAEQTCPPPSGSIETTCCPDTLLPETMTVTLSGGGACAQTITFQHYSGGIWVPAGSSPPGYFALGSCTTTAGGHEYLSMNLQCGGTNWSLSLFDSFDFIHHLAIDWTVGNYTCDPFSLELSEASVVTALGAGCCGSNFTDITVTGGGMFMAMAKAAKSPAHRGLPMASAKTPKSTIHRGKCLHLGARTEFKPGCSGWKCKHVCEAGEPEAVPGGVCQTCPKWESETT